MQRILIIGTGFAGMYAALSAARLRDIQRVAPDALEILVVSPEPNLVIRPRLYEPAPETMVAPLSPLFEAVDVRYRPGRVDAIDTAAREIGFVGRDGSEERLSYDRLILAAGSRLFMPRIPGLAEHGFNVNGIDEAVALDHHLRALAHRPQSPGRDTVVVAGGGFTGIEVATALPGRLRTILGDDTRPRVVIVERGPAVAADMGAHPRPVIEAALHQAGVEAKVGTGVEIVDASGVTLSDGTRIDSATVVWAAGMRASPLTAMIPAERDPLGRLLVDRHLRVPGIADVFATGDTCRAAADDLGHDSLMSCQHATRLGAFAGNNAAADLLGVQPEPYHQRAYVACLDLGPYGAVLTRGWDRVTELTGAEAKAMKTEINTVWIYPPRADRAAALAAAEPGKVTDL